MRKRKRQAVKKLIQCAAVIAAGVLAIILFMLAIWYRGKNSDFRAGRKGAFRGSRLKPDRLSPWTVSRHKRRNDY